METYTIIKKGENIKHCLNIPADFFDEDLEITIKPIRKQGNLRQQIETLFKKRPMVNPFKSVSDPVKWQKELRNERYIRTQPRWGWGDGSPVIPG